MKNKKGFTLIELLAVIVILAIIALIATPIVMNVIENSRKGAAERSAENYIDAVETAIMEARLDDIILSDGTYTIAELESKVGTIEVSGNKPTDGSVTIKDGIVVTDSTTTFTIGDYTVSYDAEGKITATKGNDGANTSTTVYRWSGESISIGDTIDPANYTTDPATLGKDFYLKHELDQDNKVEASYACAIFNGEEACIQGGSADYYGYADDPANYTNNLKILKGLQDEGVSCTIGQFGSGCGSLSVDPVGIVTASVNNESCVVSEDGSSSCGSV